MTFDDRDVELKGQHLVGKTVDVVVSGGIAAVEVPRLIRELRRYGAAVRVFMTPNATEFVRPLVFEWASKNPVVTELSGAAEHITHSDGVVVVPATLDFISKIALGLSDSAATTLVQSAIGRLPVFFAPSMHLSLQGNPAYAKNLNTLCAISNVKILEPVDAEGKAKMIDIETITAQICHQLSQTKLSNLSVVVSLGPTRSYADDMRYLSNRSTGALGLAIAEEFFRSGAKVFSVCGAVQVSVPHYLNPVFVETNEQMKEAFRSVTEKHKPNVGVFSAAVLDFEVSHPASGKFSSKENWDLKMKPSEKLIQSGSWPKEMMRVGFKLESRLEVDELKERAKKWATINDCRFVVANRLEDVQSKNHEAYIFSAQENSFLKASTKTEIAKKLVDAVRATL